MCPAPIWCAQFKENEELFGDYQGESEHFGDDGWLLAQKLFEMGTRLAIARVDDEFIKSKGFEVGKLMHCMLNPIFGQSEFNFHLEQYIFRIMLSKRKNMIDEEVTEEVKKILHNKLEEWKDVKFQTI